MDRRVFMRGAAALVATTAAAPPFAQSDPQCCRHATGAIHRPRSTRTRRSNRLRLLLGSGVVMSSSRNQAGDEGAEQGFAASARVVHELEEAEIKRQLVLRDTAVRSQPGAQRLFLGVQSQSVMVQAHR